MTNYRIFYQIALFVVGILLAVLGYSGTVNDIWGKAMITPLFMIL